jgi:hypothetical protein
MGFVANDLEEALNAAGASALIQKQISPLLLEYLRRYAPMLRCIPSEQWGSTVYNFNRRTALVAGGFVSDGGARPVSNSTYVQLPFTIRNLQAVGAVTGYAEAVTADLIGSLKTKEIQGTIKGLNWDIECGIDWGCAGATQYGPWPQFDGLDVQVSDFTSNTPNSTNYAGGAFVLGVLDDLIDKVESNAAEPVADDSWMFVMSSTGNSRIAQIITNQQRFNQDQTGGFGRAEVEAGLIVPTYRNVPILRSSFLQPRNNVFSTVVATPTNSGGTLPATTYYYRISAIISRFGEIQASVESSATTSGGSSIVTLSFTPPVAIEGSVAQLYKVFRSTTTGTESLLGYVDAVVGLQGDNITPIYATSIVDTGAALIPQLGSTMPATTPAAYVNTNASITPLGAGCENIYLMSRDPDNVVRPYIREVMPVAVYPTTNSPDSLPFAFVSDCCLAVRGAKYLARAHNINNALVT